MLYFIVDKGMLTILISKVEADIKIIPTPANTKYPIHRVTKPKLVLIDCAKGLVINEYCLYHPIVN